MNEVPHKYKSAGTLMLVAGIMNLLAAMGWGAALVLSLLFACISPLALLPMGVAVFEIVVGSKASGGTPAANIKTVSILGLIAAILMGNVISIILEILALIDLGRPEVEAFYRGR